MDLVVKKMKSSNSYYSKLEQMLEKVRVFGYPEGFDHQNQNYKAILKIKIPSPKEETIEEPENSDSDEEWSKQKSNRSEQKPVVV